MNVASLSGAPSCGGSGGETDQRCAVHPSWRTRRTVPGYPCRGV